MKKRSCRRTEEEKSIHEQAVRIRKMTDDQLVSHLAQEKKTNYDNGYRDGLLKGREGSKDVLKTFLDDIVNLNGIGAVTAQKLQKAAKAYGYI